MLEIIKPSQHQKVPWRNGGGYSWNIVMDGDHADKESGQFGWRFATANIDQSGPFSIYNGVERVITLIEGQGFELEWGSDDRKKFTASEAKPMHRFPGDQEAHCTLIKNPVQVLNLMYDRDLWSGETQISNPGSELNISTSADAVLLFALQGGLTIIVNNQPVALGSFDTVLLRPHGAKTDLSSTGELTEPIYLASLRKL